jgi:hypothetical protein
VSFVGWPPPPATGGGGGGGGGGAGFVNEWLADVLDKTGIESEDLSYVFDDFFTNKAWDTRFGSSTFEPLTTKGGGVYKIERAGGTQHQLKMGGIVVPSGGSGRKWYVRCRMALLTGIDSGAIMWVGLNDEQGTGTLNACTMGFHGALNGTKFIFYFPSAGGGTVQLTSSVNADASMHDLRMYSDGTTISFSVDDETPLTIAYDTFDVPVVPFIQQNSDTNGDAFAVDAILFAATKAA